MAFHNIRIHRKLIMIMVATGMGVLLLAMVAMVIMENVQTRHAVIEELHTLTDVVGWNSSAALAFADQDAGEKTLAALGSKKSVVAAYLYNSEGKIFAAYVPERVVRLTAQSHPFAMSAAFVRKNGMAVSTTDTIYAGRLHVVSPVELDGGRVGTLEVIDDLSDVTRMAQSAYLITTLIVLVSLIIIILVSSRVQRVFSDPVQSLIQTMKAVAGSRDYTTRVRIATRDEFGELAEVFNGMLAEIQVRDAQLADHGQRLEKLVAERTAQLSEAVANLKKTAREAVAARKAAEAASRAKSEFLAKMSHEIRTPLNGVLGMAELLEASPLQPRQARFARTIQNSGNALLDVINEILDFSKIESGMLDIDEHEFHLGVLMEDITDLMFEQASRKGLEVTLDMPTAARIGVCGDSHRIRQVLVNLLGNAIKFTESGRILLRVVPKEGPADYLAFDCEVIDSGIGIPAAVQSRIFEAFTQADGSTTRRYGGTGLGLAISQQLVELMGGHIELASEEGHGATFRFSLELKRVESVPNPNAGDQGQLAGRNLLIVDDTSLNREILSEFATSWQMGAGTASSAAEAINALESGSANGRDWDAIILDLHLPDVDGLELGASIRGMPNYEQVPILMLSSTQNDEDVRRAHAAGVDTYLQKPVRKQELHRILSGLVQADGEATLTPELTVDSAPATTFTGRVLVAEDNPVNQDVTQSMLEHLGLEVTIVDNGEQAVAAVEAQDFALIFMDCHMPGMDGFAASRAIRSLEGRQRPGAGGPIGSAPIVALTANVQKDVQDQCLAAGMDGYLSKPFTWEQIIEVLRARVPVQCVDHDGPAADAADVGDSPALPPAADSKEVPATGGEAILDVAILDGLRVLQRPERPDIVATAIEKFLSGLAAKRLAVSQSLAVGEANDLAEAAHFLKSSSASLGAMALSGLCRELERLGREGDLARAAELENEFELVCDQTLSDLAAYGGGHRLVKS